MEDTIAAISTPIGSGGIAIVRMSGSRALQVADAIFHSHRGRPSDFATHTIHHGSIRRDNVVVDEVLLSVMRAPQTYTKEDVVEINCHGGTTSARRVLSCCLQNGARLASPGEFTKRAFLNGRLDLTQAEAVMDIIQSQTDRAQSLATNSLEGSLSRAIGAIRSELVMILAEFEAHIDFPDEGIAPDSMDRILLKIRKTNETARSLLKTGRQGRLLRGGASAALIGRTNAGKSSLMNALLGEDRVIVSRTHGTTRDAVEEMVDIKGVPIRLIDTAGIRKSRSNVETIGMTISHKTLQNSDLVLHVIDSSSLINPTDLTLHEKYSNSNVILVLSKADKKRKCILPNNMRTMKTVSTSTLDGSGLDQLRSLILDALGSSIDDSSHLEFTINVRHDEILRRVTAILDEAISSDSEIIDVTSELVRRAIYSLDECIGVNISEQVLDALFSKFCVGK
jgi:tRNA modification GTPase